MVEMITQMNYRYNKNCENVFTEVECEAVCLWANKNHLLNKEISQFVESKTLANVSIWLVSANYAGTMMVCLVNG